MADLGTMEWETFFNQEVATEISMIYLSTSGIEIEEGSEDDAPDKVTVHGLGNKKNELFSEVLAEKGIEVYPSTIEIIKLLRHKGVKIACGSSSKNCQKILQTAGLYSIHSTSFIHSPSLNHTPFNCVFIIPQSLYSVVFTIPQQ
jgi:FMN phosphatase YigB (HAD superfamily)